MKSYNQKIRKNKQAAVVVILSLLTIFFRGNAICINADASKTEAEQECKNNRETIIVNNYLEIEPYHKAYWIDLDEDGDPDTIRADLDTFSLYINGKECESGEKIWSNYDIGMSVCVYDLDRRTDGLEIVYMVGVEESPMPSYLSDLRVWKLARYVDGKYETLMTDTSLMDDYGIDITKNNPLLEKTGERTFTLEVEKPWDFGGMLGRYYSVKMPFVYDDNVARFNSTQSITFVRDQYSVLQSIELHETYEEDSPVIETVPSGYIVRPLTVFEISPDEAMISIMYQGKIGYAKLEEGLLKSIYE